MKNINSVIFYITYGEKVHDKTKKNTKSKIKFENELKYFNRKVEQEYF